MSEIIDVNDPLFKKDLSLIKPWMKKIEDCPCPDENCNFHGYCELCTAHHKHHATTYCSLPPGKDQYLKPWGEGMRLAETYVAIQKPTPDMVNFSDCSCTNTKCLYHGYCDLCIQHVEKYRACTTSCDKLRKLASE